VWFAEQIAHLDEGETSRPFKAGGAIGLTGEHIVDTRQVFALMRGARFGAHHLLRDKIAVAVVVDVGIHQQALLDQPLQPRP